MERMMLAASLLTMALAMAAAPAAAQPPSPATPAVIAPLYVVSYLEFADDYVHRGAGAMIEYRGKSLREPGNANIELFQEIGYPSRYAILEMWQNSAAQETHAKATGDAPRADWMKTGATAPADVRLHKRYNTAGALAPTSKAIYAITHVDVPPARLAETEALIKPLVEKSRQEKGFMRFDIWQSTTRPNHFTFVEGWESAEAAQAHAVSAHARDFREKLNPMLGALYDQRYYRFLP